MHTALWPRLLVVAAAALLGSSIVAPPRASAANIACGDTIFASTTLDADLTCSTYGINIGADNITLDLGGHTITNAGAAGPGVFVGAQNPANLRSGATVRNGTIVGFYEGVRLQHAANNTVSNVRVMAGGPGFAIVIHLDSDNNTVQDCIIEAARAGISITDSSDGNTVRGCSISGQTVGGISVGGFGAPPLNNQLVENNISGNGCATDAACGFPCEATSSPPAPGTANTCGNGAHGISISQANGTIVRGNTIAVNRGEGISASQSALTEVTGNTVTGNGIAFRRSGSLWVGANGILFTTGSTLNTISGNTLSANGGHGIQLARAGSPVTLPVDNNTIRDNHISGNTRLGITINESGNNEIRGNIVANNGATTNDHGISVAGSVSNAATGNVVSGNTVSGSSGHGIVVGAHAEENTVEDNLVSTNARVGIAIGSATAPASLNSVRLNRVLQNGQGINLGAGAVNNTLAANIVTANKDAGIRLGSAAPLPTGNEVTGNTASGNGTAPGAVPPAPFAPLLPFDIVDLAPLPAGVNNVHTNYCLLGNPAALCVPQPSTVATAATPTGNAPLGASATDTATVSGGGPTPTGAVKFFLCQPSQVTAGGCEGSAGAQVGAPPAGEALAAGIATSEATSNTTATGKYCWRAEYSGDPFYLPSTHTNATTECFTAAATVQTLTSLVNSLVTDGSITTNANGLLAKLAAAQAALDRGQKNVASNQLNAFINEVNAQRGKGITTAAADLLIQQATLVIASLS